MPEIELGYSARATSALNCISPFFGILSEQAKLQDIKNRSFHSSDPSVHPFLMGGTKPQIAPDALDRADSLVLSSRSLRQSGNESSHCWLGLIQLSTTGRLSTNSASCWLQLSDPMLSWADLSTTVKTRGITACSGPRLPPVLIPWFLPCLCKVSTEDLQSPSSFYRWEQSPQGANTLVQFTQQILKKPCTNSLAVKQVSEDLMTAVHRACSPHYQHACSQTLGMRALRDGVKPGLGPQWPRSYPRGGKRAGGEIYNTCEGRVRNMLEELRKGNGSAG